MWIMLALAAAAAATAREAIIKSAMRPGDELPVSLILMGTTGLLLAPLALTAIASPGYLPQLLRPYGSAGPASSGFWWALAVSGVINAAAAVMIARAVHVSDLSLVSPLQSTTPAFMVVAGFLILGERPDGSGLAGILLIVLGAWILNVERRGAGGWGGPLRALVHDRGARLFLGVALIYGISASVDKVGVRASSPALWAASLHVTAALILALATVRAGGLADLRRVRSAAGPRLVLAGGVLALGATAQMAALPLTLAAYVIAVKRTSVLMSVVAGGAFFGEREWRRRLAGAAVMLLGLGLITLL